MTTSTSLSLSESAPEDLQDASPGAVPETTPGTVQDHALRGLAATPRTLPPWLFYDQRGSELFEQITELPEYYLTRTERSLLATHTGDILHEFLFPGAPGDVHLPAPDPFTIAELGAGSSAKTGILLQAAINLQPRLLYQPIDVSPTALASAAAALTASIPGLTVHPQTSNYVSGAYTLQTLLPSPAAWPGSTGGDPLHTPRRLRTLVLWIGSSIGNFPPCEAERILTRLRSRLQPQDALLLGADLAPSRRKPVSTILSAYNDAAGVTASFNRNILTRLNRELDADFVPESFAHRARWNAVESRIEMHLESSVHQTVHIPVQGQVHRISFAAGETIHTENSYKFRDGGLDHLLTRAGFSPARSFHDLDRTFSLTLAHVR